MKVRCQIRSFYFTAQITSHKPFLAEISNINIFHITQYFWAKSCKRKLVEPTEHFGIYFGYIRRLFQSWVSPLKPRIRRCLGAKFVDTHICNFNSEFLYVHESAEGTCLAHVCMYLLCIPPPQVMHHRIKFIQLHQCTVPSSCYPAPAAGLFGARNSHYRLCAASTTSAAEQSKHHVTRTNEARPRD